MTRVIDLQWILHITVHNDYGDDVCRLTVWRDMYKDSSQSVEMKYVHWLYAETYVKAHGRVFMTRVIDIQKLFHITVHNDCGDDVCIFFDVDWRYEETCIKTHRRVFMTRLWYKMTLSYHRTHDWGDYVDWLYAETDVKTYRRVVMTRVIDIQLLFHITVHNDYGDDVCRLTICRDIGKDSSQSLYDEGHRYTMTLSYHSTQRLWRWCM